MLHVNLHVVYVIDIYTDTSTIYMYYVMHLVIQKKNIHYILSECPTSSDN